MAKKESQQRYHPNPFTDYGWVREGMFWGLAMYFLMAILFPIFIGDGLILKQVLIEIPLWAIGGLAFGYTMKVIKG